MSKQRKKGTQEADDHPTKKKRMRTCMETIHRIIHDPSLPSECFLFGYLDRFVGIIERTVDSADWSDIATLDLKKTMAVPKHRIQYIKCNGQIVWDKRPESRVDLFWEGKGINHFLNSQIERGIWSWDDLGKIKNKKNDETNESDEKNHKKLSFTHAKRKKNSGGSSHGGSSHGGSGGHDIRPNYFVCVRISNDNGRRIVSKAQSELINNAAEDGVKGLSEGCVPLRALHVTLTTLYCATKNDLDAAANTISSHFLRSKEMIRKI